ncbi:MAG: hypothetical protein GY754_02815 [bacterium]|nr:hypothetical protein [bacterium]
MDLKNLFKRYFLLLSFYAILTVFISACSNQGSWDTIQDQEQQLEWAKQLVTLSAVNSTIDENAQTATIKATVSKVCSSNVTIRFSFSGTASVGSDYSVSSKTLVIPAGSQSAALDINIIDDTLNEGSETIIVDIDAVDKGTEQDTQQAVITITDNDVLTASLSLAGSGTIAEDGSSETVKVSLSTTSISDVTVTLAYGGNAANTVDYTRSAASVTIPAGSTEAAVQITSVGDALDETDETVTIDIDSVVNASENGVQQKTITISDDDASPAVQFTAASSSGNENPSIVSAEVSISAVSALPVDVSYSVSGGTAAGSGTDYTLTAGTVTISAGSTTANISIQIHDDSLDEADETVKITLSSPVNATLGGNTTHTYTITDNDASPTVQFNAPAVGVGTEATTPLSIGVSLSAVSGQTVTVDYAVTGTATAGADYTPANGTVSIAAGSTAGTMSITIIDDTLAEDDETLIVTLSNPGNAALGSTIVYTYTISENDKKGPAVTAAEYYDVDANGRLDHIKITLDGTVNDSTFDGYNGDNALGTVTSKWAVAGYVNVKIDNRDAIDGGSANDSVIWLAFDEKTDIYDTGVKPELTVTDASLKGLDSGNCYFNTSGTACTNQTAADLAAGGVTETDKAPPVLVDAAGNVGFNQVVATFSEPVDSDGGACDSLLDAGDFGYTDGNGSGVSQVSGMGTDCSACDDSSVTVGLNGNLIAADAGSDTIKAKASSVYDSAGNTAEVNSRNISSIIATVGDYSGLYSFNGTNTSNGNGSGNNNFTTGGGTPTTTTNRNGTAGGAISLNPYAYFVLNSPGFNLTTEMTISIWVRDDNCGGSTTNILRQDNPDHSRVIYGLALETPRIRFFIRDTTDASVYINNLGNIPRGAWTHLALTWKTGGKLRIYQNGKIIGETNATSNPIAAQSGDCFIGSQAGNPSSNHFNGAVDDFRVLPKELSPAEIAVLYHLPAD